jgi:cobalt-zinc-cadmium efflux system membrane fusion protein
MRAAAVAMIMLVLALPGCRQAERGEEGHGHAPDEHAADHQDERGRDARDVLRIEPDMLRDLRLTTARAEEPGSVEGVSVLGDLGPDEDAYAVIASPIPARIVRLHAAPASSVHAGEPLAELQSPELGKARAELLATQARLQLALRTLARKRALAVERIAPRREVEEAEAAATTARADAAAAEAALQALGVSRSDMQAGRYDSSTFVLRSPIAGTVIDRSGAQGEMADPSRPLYRIADLSRLWLTVHAFERDAVRLAPGTTARVQFAALPGRTFTGPITNVGRRVEGQSKTVAVRVEIENPDGVLRPGMSATATLPVGEQVAGVLAVPAAALQRLAQGWCVFVPHGEGAFQVRPVGRGRDLGGTVEILSGLEAGDEVVVDGAFLLKAQAEKSHGEGAGHAH